VNNSTGSTQAEFIVSPIALSLTGLSTAQIAIMNVGITELDVAVRVRTK
jgi:hypothetical protein